MNIGDPEYPSKLIRCVARANRIHILNPHLSLVLQHIHDEKPEGEALLSYVRLLEKFCTGFNLNIEVMLKSDTALMN